MERYNVSIFTENRIGILSRITIIFTRRYLNIESITASECEIPNVYRYTIVLTTAEDQIKKVVGQIERQIDVLKAFYHTDEQVVSQELAMYKCATPEFIKNKNVEQIIRNHQAKILSIETEFVMIEKTGTEEEIINLYNDLKEIRILEFARSGRVAISKPMKTLTEYLNEI